MARHRAHPPIIAAGPVTEDRRQAAHRPRARVADVVGGVDVPEQHEPGRHLRHPLPEGAATHELDLVLVIVGRVEDAVGRTVGDEDVKPLRNLVPEPVDRAAVAHVGPVTVARREG